MRYYYQSCLYYWKLALICPFMTTIFLIGCSHTKGGTEFSQSTQLIGAITEIDDHGNAVTDLVIAPFITRGWELGDTLKVTFATGQKIQIKLVENYGDVPVGDYLGRFSTTTKRFKIAINSGNIAKTLELESPSRVVLKKVDSPATD